MFNAHKNDQSHDICHEQSHDKNDLSHEISL